MVNRGASKRVREGVSPVEVLRVRAGVRESQSDEVAVEEPLEIRIHGETFATTMRTPGSDAELVAGLLFAEGLIESRADLGTIAHCGRPGDEGYGNVIDVIPASGVVIEPESLVQHRRGTLVTSACGVCGRRTIADLIERVRPLDDTTLFSPQWLASLPEALIDEQANFSRTGGLHAAAIAPHGGSFYVVREDVGRHNAVDKVIGRLLLDGELPAGASALLVSGRSSFEIVQKAVRAGIPALISVSAPSSLAVATAERFGLLLLGFARQGGFNVYSGWERLESTARMP